MFAKSISDRLLANTTITTLLGGNNIYYHRVPPGATMPWISIKILPGGENRRLTTYLTEPYTMFEIAVEDNDVLAARNVIQAVLDSLDYFRGDLSDDDDVYIRMGYPYSMDGDIGAVRWIAEGTIRSKETTTVPT